MIIPHASTSALATQRPTSTSRPSSRCTTSTGRRRDRDGYATAGLSTGRGGRSRGRRRPHRPRHPTRPASAPAVGLSSRGSRLFQRRLLARVPVLSGDRRRSDAGERAVDTAAQRPSDRNEQRCLWGAVRCRRHRHRLVDGYPDRRPGALETHDPDVLVCSTSEIVPTLYEMATDAGVDDFSLSRWPDVDYQQLASRSTYSSYGRVGHSPARYNVARPGDHRRVEHVLLRGDEP